MILARRGLKWVKMVESEQNWMEVSSSQVVHVPAEGGPGSPPRSPSSCRGHGSKT